MKKNNKSLVISAVNITEGGTLKIVRDFLYAISKVPTISATVYVHKNELYPEYENINYIERPSIKSSWIKRLWFEYVECRSISAKIKPDLWISLHDTSPIITFGQQVVYCHNPSPFYSRKLSDLYYSPRFYIFTLLYKFLYRINIKNNQFVIVQQEWIADAFVEMYHIENVLVSRPDVDGKQCNQSREKDNNNQISLFDERIVFFYPSLSRTFKNFEVICEAVQKLEPEISEKVRVVLTIDGTEDLYSRSIFAKYNHLSSIDFVGKLTYEEVIKQYMSTSVVLFPSRLETWGLPISEAKNNNLPLVVSDLPYAHETVGNYDKVVFFDSTSADDLCDIMRQISLGLNIFKNHVKVKSSRLNVDGFDNLVSYLINHGVV